MRSRLVTCVLVVAALSGGCSLDTRGDVVIDGPVAPPSPRELGAAPADPPVDERAGGGVDEVVLIGPDRGLVVAERPSRRDRSADAQRALDTLLAPMSTAEVERGWSTAVPSATVLVGYREHDRGRVEIELSVDFDAPGTETNVDLRLGQVACTVSLLVPVTVVEIVIEGQTMATVRVDDCPRP